MSLAWGFTEHRKSLALHLEAITDNTLSSSRVIIKGCVWSGKCAPTSYLKSNEVYYSSILKYFSFLCVHSHLIILPSASAVRTFAPAPPRQCQTIHAHDYLGGEAMLFVCTFFFYPDFPTLVDYENISTCIFSPLRFRGSCCAVVYHLTSVIDKWFNFTFNTCGSCSWTCYNTTKYNLRMHITCSLEI